MTVPAPRFRTILDDGVFTHGKVHASTGVEYFLITRYCMKLPSFRETGGVADPEKFDIWIKKRQAIFSAICLPSVVQQTRRPDYWFLGFDEERREQFEPVLQMIRKYKWIVPLWQKTINGEPDNSRMLFVNAIKERTSSAANITITSRLDNDDALSKSFCEAVQDYALSVDGDNFWISFPFGTKYDGTCCRFFPLNNNPFLSRIEPSELFRRGAAQSALYRNHSAVFSYGKVYLPITRFPMWLQYVHDSNVSNAASTGLSKFEDTLDMLKRFGVAGPADFG